MRYRLWKVQNLPIIAAQLNGRCRNHAPFSGTNSPNLFQEMDLAYVTFPFQYCHSQVHGLADPSNWSTSSTWSISGAPALSPQELSQKSSLFEAFPQSLGSTGELWLCTATLVHSLAVRPHLWSLQVVLTGCPESFMNPLHPVSYPCSFPSLWHFQHFPEDVIFWMFHYQWKE